MQISIMINFSETEHDAGVDLDLNDDLLMSEYTGDDDD
jgi:hypothetical protein